MRSIRLIDTLIFTALFILTIPAIASANSMYLGPSSHLIKPQKSTEISLERQVLQVWLRHGYAEVENVYQFRNDGEPQTFMVGLPEEINSKDAVKYGVFNFSAYVDGNPVEARTSKTDNEKLGSLSGTINWHRHAVFIGKGERRIVVHRYWVRISPARNKFVLPLEPASSWKGKIGRADYVVHLAGTLTEKRIIYPPGYGDFEGKYAVLPVGFTTGKNQIQWRFSNFEPRQDMVIEFFTKTKKSVSEVEASSVHVEGGKKFTADYAVDQDASTAWGFGGPGKKERITLSFDKKKWVREFRIIPGYGQLEGMYKYFNRPRNVTLMFSDGSKQSFELKDELEMQYIPVEPVQTDYVVMEVNSVYKGVYPDVTYISEIEFGEAETGTRVNPSEWKVGLQQIDSIDTKSKYSIVDLITIAATVTVFLFIGWQVVVAIKRRKESN